MDLGNVKRQLGEIMLLLSCVILVLSNLGAVKNKLYKLSEENLELIKAEKSIIALLNEVFSNAE